MTDTPTTRDVPESDEHAMHRVSVAMFSMPYSADPRVKQPWRIENRRPTLPEVADWLEALRAVLTEQAVAHDQVRQARDELRRDLTGFRRIIGTA